MVVVRGYVRPFSAVYIEEGDGSGQRLCETICSILSVSSMVAYAYASTHIVGSKLLAPHTVTYTL